MAAAFAVIVRIGPCDHRRLGRSHAGAGSPEYCIQSFARHWRRCYVELPEPAWTAVTVRVGTGLAQVRDVLAR
jgi:hypothetical protein